MRYRLTAMINLPSTDYDVAIAGAGPTGLVTATLLGLAGIRTLLLERNAGTVNEPRAVSIDDESLRTMQACGLIDQVLANVASDYGSIYVDAAGAEFARVMPTLRDYGYPRRNAFRQPLLEATLRDGLRRFPHVDVLFGHALETFTQDDAGVTLTVRRDDGGIGTYRAQFLAAADGGRSIVRKAIGARLEGSSFEERWLIVDLERTEDPLRETRVTCDPDRPAISLPGPHRTRRYEIRLKNGETDDDILQPESIAALLAARGPDAASPILRKRVYTFHARRADIWSQGRVFLLGDAAHLTPPFAGQGMNTGVRDAQNFAWKVAAVVRGTFSPRLLETYQQERSPHAWSMIKLALRMGAVMAPHKRWVAFMTRWVFRLLSLVPPAKDYVAQMRFKPKPRFDAGFIHRPAGRSLVGTMFPQPLVETANGERILLDQVMGPGFALVCLADDATPLFNSIAGPPWDTLQPARVHILPRSLAFAPECGAKAVRDLNGFFAGKERDFADRLFVIRPDRYVAAELPLGYITRASADFSALCARYGLGDATSVRQQHR